MAECTPAAAWVPEMAAHGPSHRTVHGARADALHVDLLDRGGERLLGGAPPLQELGEVAPLAQLGDLE